MTIAEAKQVRIVDFLAQLGHHAQHIKSEQYWYFSPLRNERTPSFKVNDRINDHYREPVCRPLHPDRWRLK